MGNVQSGEFTLCGSTVKVETYSAKGNKHYLCSLRGKLADLGLVGERIGRVAAQHDIFNAPLNAAQRVRVAKDVEAALAHRVDDELRDVGSGHLAAADRLVAHRLRDELALADHRAAEEKASVRIRKADLGEPAAKRRAPV